MIVPRSRDVMSSVTYFDEFPQKEGGKQLKDTTKSGSRLECTEPLSRSLLDVGSVFFWELAR